MKSLSQVLQDGKACLNSKGIADAEIDAWYLLSHVFALKRVEFLMRSHEIADEVACREYKALLKRRAEHEPLQYIIQSQNFMGLEFYVNENVLIPRPETEELVNEVLKVSEGKEVLDMCTGSGCIIISLAKLGSLKSATGVDISEGALEIARKNAKAHGVEVDFIESDLFANIKGNYDIIVSNPPYIPTQDVLELMPEVKEFEPRLALDGKEDGLYFYRKIIKESKKYLKPKGRMFFEIGYNQAEDIIKMLIHEKFEDIRIMKDLSNLDRMVSCCNGIPGL